MHHKKNHLSIFNDNSEKPWIASEWLAVVGTFVFDLTNFGMINSLSPHLGPRNGEKRSEGLPPSFSRKNDSALFPRVGGVGPKKESHALCPVLGHGFNRMRQFQECPFWNKRLRRLNHLKAKHCQVTQCLWHRFARHEVLSEGRNLSTIAEISNINARGVSSYTVVRKQPCRLPSQETQLSRNDTFWPVFKKWMWYQHLCWIFTHTWKPNGQELSNYHISIQQELFFLVVFFGQNLSWIFDNFWLGNFCSRLTSDPWILHKKCDLKNLLNPKKTGRIFTPG